MAGPSRIGVTPLSMSPMKTRHARHGWGFGWGRFRCLGIGERRAVERFIERLSIASGVTAATGKTAAAPRTQRRAKAPPSGSPGRQSRPACRPSRTGRASTPGARACRTAPTPTLPAPVLVVDRVEAGRLDHAAAADAVGLRDVGGFGYGSHLRPFSLGRRTPATSRQFDVSRPHPALTSSARVLTLAASRHGTAGSPMPPTWA